MSNFELYINGLLIEGVEQEIALSYATNKLQDVESRSGDYSNTFKLKKTASIKKALENSQEINSGTFLPYRKLAAEIYENGTLIIIGFAKIQEAGEYFLVNVLGGNSEVYRLISDKKLSELDFQRFDHLYIESIVIANRLNSWASGFIYPNIDYNDQWKTATSIVRPYTEFFPSTYCRVIFEQIFTDIGYSVEGDFLNDSLFLKEILPFSLEEITDCYYYYDHRGVYATQSKTQSITAGATTKIILGKKTEEAELRDPGVKVRLPIGGTVPGTLYDTTTSSYTATTSFWLRFGTIQVVMDFGAIVTHTTSLTVYLNGSPTALTTSVSRTTFDNFDFVILNFDIVLASGDSIDVRILSNQNHTILDYGYVTGNFEKTYLYGMPDLSVPDYQVSLSRSLPDIGQKEFLKTIVNQYNLIFETDNIDKTVKVRRFEEISGNLNAAEDWSSLIDLSEEPIITFDFGSYGQKSTFLYKEESSDPYLKDRPEYGEGLIDVDNEHLDLSKTVFKSVFAPVWRELSFNNTKEVAKQFLGSPRIAYVEITNQNLINIGSGEVVAPGGTASQSAEVFFDKLIFQNSLLPSYYGLFAGIFDRVKYLRILVRIKETNIAKLNFSIPIYLNISVPGLAEYSGFFYLNIINQYQPGSSDSCWVELLKLNL